MIEEVRVPQRFPYPPGTPCSKCRGPLGEGRRHRYCPGCARDYKRNRRPLPGQREREVAAHRVRTYGVNAEAYGRLAAAQGGVCAVCRKPETATRRGIVKTLAVDHDHGSGLVRGLLCGRCNTALGLLGESVQTIHSLLAYLTTSARAA